MSDKSLWHEVKDWAVSIAIAIVLAFFIRYFIVELYMVEGPSMQPTLISGERLVVNKFIYRFRAPERNEVLVFKYPRDPSRDFIKRVIAVEGDTIEINDGKVFLNGKLMDEPYIRDKTRGSYPLSTVPPNTVFVMGDNRNNSEDSRFKDVGFVSLEMLKGKAMVVFWPIDRMKSLP